MDIFKPENKNTSLPMLITFGCMVAALINVIFRFFK